MKRVILALLFLGTWVGASAQKQGLGLRLGEPTGITYKRYFGMRAVEFGLGSSGAGAYSSYYRNSFEAMSRFDDYNYRSHRVRSTLYLQGRYLFHNEIWVEGLEGKWDWYWGLGAMLKFANVRYRFDDDTPPVKNEDTINDIDLGPEGVVGMEYVFQDVPITLFAETSLLVEIVNRVTLRPFGGVGVRYNFH